MIVDTGILYALADRSDKHHAAAKKIFSTNAPRVVPEPVITETDWMILSRLGRDAELGFLRGLAELVIEAPSRQDRARAAEVAEQYADLELGYVDAIIVALAERLGESTLATVDHRHFAAVRPRHVEAFDIVP